MKSAREYSIRPATPMDADEIIRVHHDAVRVLCARDYSAEQIAAWCSLEDDCDWLAQRIATPRCLVVVAELYGTIAGFAEKWRDEIGAVYVHPFHTRRGVASMMMERVERTAAKEHIDVLRVDASLTAEPFYRAIGFEVISRGTHTFRNGTVIESVKMAKRLRGLKTRVAGRE